MAETLWTPTTLSVIRPPSLHQPTATQGGTRSPCLSVCKIIPHFPPRAISTSASTPNQGVDTSSARRSS
ncbi:hypothetical protein ARMGADRAFT_1008781 [Armillaria gallica]|uniref:Uncharacterized protein n=1 Tax=Armillaria gallica TaxID=47427 RepID=A0A2H3DSZ2_ARMGA|nr:hypothetical protein ARMGADRAFT_1008781 [Armillaria gallica]